MERVVVKLGGGAAAGGAGPASLAGEVEWLRSARLAPVLVHGGGPEISAWLGRLGVESRFVDGLRVTDPVTADVAEMVLAGHVNKRLVGALVAAGVPAVGVSGKDGGLFRGSPSSRAELGLVAEAVRADPAVLEALLAAGYVPVVAPVVLSPAGETLNVNADTAAAALAAALGARALVVLTDVDGIRTDAADPATRVDRLSAAEGRRLLAGSALNGMVPKLQACLAALEAGVPRVHVVPAAAARVICRAVAGETGLGTVVLP